MNSKTKDTAKTKANAKAKKQVKLKPTTRAMVHRAKLMRALYPFARDVHARDYRESRRNGLSNLYICHINRPIPDEMTERIEDECTAPEAASAEQATKSELAADPASHEDSQVLSGQGQVVDEHDSTSSPTPTSRRRRPCLVPQKRQAEFSFGSDKPSRIL